MKISINPAQDQWEQLLGRPFADNSDIMESVHSILREVRHNGDDALRSFSRKFDGVELTNLEVTESEIIQANKVLDPALLNAIGQAAENIHKFHRAQIPAE